jgi:hypothetical protein
MQSNSGYRGEIRLLNKVEQHWHEMRRGHGRHPAGRGFSGVARRLHLAPGRGAECFHQAGAVNRRSGAQTLARDDPRGRRDQLSRALVAVGAPQMLKHLAHLVARRCDRRMELNGSGAAVPSAGLTLLTRACPDPRGRRRCTGVGEHETLSVR